MNDNINIREVEILKAIPKSQIPDFIEKKGQQLRELINSDEDLDDKEIIEILILGYRGL